jgi:uncharacterized protein
MERVNKILNHKKYKECIKRNSECEIDRKFCHHDMIHFLDVCRIMYIVSLEKNSGFNKEIIYACGILHDIGRWKQYQDGTPHDIASVQLAKEILEDCSFNGEEMEQILNAIKNHRNKNNEDDSLGELLYKSDKLSRKCFDCSAEDECNWDNEKKNLKLKY